jgi:hypothetical protein
MKLLTFSVVDSPNKKLLTKKFGGTCPKTCRFWVKLGDTFSLDINVVEF